MSHKIELQFRPGLSPQQRALAEEAALAMAQRAAEASAKRRADSQQMSRDATVGEAEVTAPPAGDSGQMSSLAEFLTFEAGKASPDLRAAPQRTAVTEGPATPFIVAATLVPPFDFAWRLYDPLGAPAYETIGATDGVLSLDARTGPFQGGADTFVNAHVGVGCNIMVDHAASIYLHAKLQSRFQYKMRCRGLNATATSDGGIDTAVMRNGAVVLAGTLPLWHRRISSFEDAETGEGWQERTYPDGMASALVPGAYTFNVGIWSVADASSGFLALAGVHSLLSTNVQEMQYALV